MILLISSITLLQSRWDSTKS